MTVAKVIEISSESTDSRRNFAGAGGHENLSAPVA